MYKIFVILMLAAVGYVFWRMGPGNEVTYYEDRSTTKTESFITK